MSCRHKAPPTAIDAAAAPPAVHILEDPGVEPSHTLGLKLQTVELRLDYMGTSVLMGRVSALDATLRDEWRISPQLDAPHQDATKRSAAIHTYLLAT